MPEVRFYSWMNWSIVILVFSDISDKFFSWTVCVNCSLSRSAGISKILNFGLLTFGVLVTKPSCRT